jgi:hypothetical protein
VAGAPPQEGFSVAVSGGGSGGAHGGEAGYSGIGWAGPGSYGIWVVIARGPPLVAARLQYRADRIDRRRSRGLEVSFRLPSPVPGLRDVSRPDQFALVPESGGGSEVGGVVAGGVVGGVVVGLVVGVVVLALEAGALDGADARDEAA